MQAKNVWLCLVLFAVATGERVPAESGIRWQPNLEAAKRLAAQTNRLVLMHFWTESCGPCMKMEREVFSRPEVAAAIEANFVPVRVNVQIFPLTAREYGVNAWPADVIMTPQGSVIFTRKGGLGAAQYVDMMNQVAARARGTSSPAYAQAGQAPSYSPSAAAAQGGAPGDASRPWTPSAAAQQPGSRPSSVQGMEAASHWGGAVGQRVPAAGGPPSDQPAAATPSQGASPRAFAAYTPPRQPDVATGPTDYGRAGLPPGYASVSQAQPDAPAATQPPIRSWQGETARWNPNGTPPRADFAQAPGRPPQASVPDQTAGRNFAAAPRGELVSRPSVTTAQELAGPRDVSPSAPPAADPKAPPLALDGYCPVTLSQKEQWVKGDPRYGVIHRGRTYLFIGPEEAKAFFAAPDRYAPVLSGMDVVIAVEERRQVPGRREYGAWYEGQVYLFASEASYQKFDQAPARYAAAIKQGSTITARRPPDSWDRPPYHPDPANRQFPTPERY